MTTSDGCEFVDRFGISNRFTDSRRDPKGRYDRDLFLRVQMRARGGWLPYGIRWTDSYREVLRKIRPHGGEPSVGGSLSITGCWSPQSDGYWVNFEFDAAGRLDRVEQGFQAY